MRPARIRPSVAALALASLFAAGPARAQDPQPRVAREAIEDAATWRAALGTTLWANVRASALGDAPLVLRIASDALAFQPLDHAPFVVAVADDDAPWPLRMAAALLTTGPLDDAFEALGAELVHALVTWDVLDLDDGPALVRRIGTDVASAALAEGTSAPRALRVRRTDGDWTARVTRDYAPAHGWYPARIEVERDGEAVLSIDILDLAATADALAPLARTTAARATSARIPRLPRLPL